MKYFRSIRYLCIIILLLPGCSSGPAVVIECFFVRQYASRIVPKPEIHTINVRSEKGSRLDIYQQMPYARLRFSKETGEYRAEYSVSFILRKEDDSVAAFHDIVRNVTAENYERTVSPARDVFMYSFYPPPGGYTLEAITTDEGSKLHSAVRVPLIVPDYGRSPLSASDCLFFENISRSGGREIVMKPISPKQAGFLKDSIGIYQEIYDIHKDDIVSVSTSYSLARMPDEQRRKMLRRYPPDRFRVSQCAIQFEKPYYSKSSFIIPGEFSVYRMIRSYIPPKTGYNRMERVIIRSRNGIIDSTITTGRIFITPPFFPAVKMADDLIDALGLIASEEEVDSLRSSKSEDERMEAYLNFWRKSGGERRRIDFENRLKEANELFSACVEGWRTPMGITYVICGIPDYVECQGDIKEIWSYGIGANSVMTVPFQLDQRSVSEPVYEIISTSVSDYQWQYFVDQWRKKTK